ncbi:MAG: hypothetical protein JO117_02210, partial [Verrucomicrobia bacterium]|nr:hypothetical protein [Verrucomicrobiota bacterium]
MAKIFLWLSGLLLLGSVALGWLNTNRLGAVRQEKDQAVADAGAARTQADKARKDLTAVQTQLTAAKTISNEAQSKIDAANAEAARLQGELTTNQTQLTAVQTELTELKNRVAPANGIVTGGPAAGSGEDLQQKIHDLETRLAEFATVKKALDEQLRAADAN